MNLPEEGVLSAVVPVVLGLLALALAISGVRLARGPSLPDRVVALDLMATLSVGIIAVYTIATGQWIFLRVAAVVALITFLGTVAFARYVARSRELT